MNATERHTADCGHDYTPPGPNGGASGYAVASDGKTTMCYTCAAEQTRRDMANTGPGQRFDGLYLTTDGRHLTTWSGEILASVTSTKISRNAGFEWRRQSRYYIRAVDLDGGRWYGTSPGPDMYARLRRVKP